MSLATRLARGGRNQHFALYLATLLRPDDAPIAILSAGSDGIDGNQQPLPAPSSTTALWQPPRSAKPDSRALETFDSSTLLGALGATIVTGPTGHNLRDLRILLAGAANH